MQIDEIETALRGAGVPITHFYKQAPIAHTTWERWKAGKTTPNFSTWERCREAFLRLCPAGHQAA